MTNYRQDLEFQKVRHICRTIVVCAMIAMTTFIVTSWFNMRLEKERLEIEKVREEIKEGGKTKRVGKIIPWKGDEE